ncbi:hypothetical protein AVEN_109852-1 [Araneus ventricosus]|uniref:Uncharacterized protein n=1 Tax=Araneus ventricosus TaxID=182803 RepID=A0A4Y2L6C0_ARAVE|nr:hypothetical protein AVEN_109852-1 [Araneus ventricosus]
MVISTTKIRPKIINEVLKEYGISDTHEFTDIAVSFDGTRLTRGHTSQIVVGCAIDILRSCVIHYEVMSKHYTECEYAKTDLVEKSAEYIIWFESHEKAYRIITLEHQVHWKWKLHTNFSPYLTKLAYVIQQFFQESMKKH